MVSCVWPSARGQDPKAQLDEALNLSQKGVQLDKAGRLDEAILMLEKALEIRQELLPADHSLLVNSLFNLGMSLLHKKHHARAKQLLTKAVEISEKASDPNIVNYALSLNGLGMVYAAESRYTLAESYVKRAVDILEKTPGTQYPFLAEVLSNLALVRKENGDPSTPERLYLRALGIIEQATNPEHPDLCPVLNNLGLLYEEKGDLEHAVQYLSRAVNIHKKTWGVKGPNYAIMVAVLGEILEQAYDFETAERVEERALQIARESLGDENRLVADFMYKLGSVRVFLRKYDLAEPLLREGMRIREKLLGKEHPDVALSLSSLAKLYEAKHDYANAETCYRRALEILDRAVTHQHLTATILSDFAMMHKRRGDSLRALPYLERSVELAEKITTLNLTWGSQQQKQAYLDSTNTTFGIVSFHTNDLPESSRAARLALTSIVQNKGRVLDAMSDQIASLRRRADPDSQRLFDQLDDAMTQWANLRNSGREQLSPEALRKETARLEAEKERLEGEIAYRSSEFQSLIQPFTLDLLRKAIPPHTALAEIFLYHPFNIEAEGLAQMYGPARYVAYVLLRDEEVPRWVELGEAESIDTLVKHWRANLRNPKSEDFWSTARALDERVMRPIRKLLGPIRHVFISPDGQLTLIPFAALVDENGRYLIEDYSVSYLTSGRDLLRPQAKAESRETLRVFADPLYDLTAPTEPGRAAAQAPARTVNSQRSKDFFASGYDQLPGTAAEAEAIRSLFPNAVLFTQGQATEAALKRVNRPRMLHIATHGFFQPDQPEATEGTLGLGFGMNKTPPITTNKENPLLRSGLVLAGIKQFSSGAGEDGVLTALEVSGLDLWATKLVVLSACDTALGDVKNGEGVYGLRRALVLAGSETQVMSLWKVDDSVTRDLMVAYYTRLQKGEGRAEALRQVQLEMVKSKNRHPYYWASFIASGNWRNLAGQER
jgi:CHAT domain-containing protein/Tfp pilus assembly protein PilF